MSRFVRQSSFRHTYGQPAKKDKQYENIKISASAWDTNLVAVSGKFLSVNYQSSGGGAFLVTPLDLTGKLPDLFPLCRAHTAPVLDTAWSPFDDSLIASAGEDGRVAITQVDEESLRDAWSGDHEVKDLEPSAKISAHGRKVGHVLWHPTANNILASASTEVKLWDVSAEKAAFTSEIHADMVQSLSFDYTGTNYATTCKDKKLRLFDARSSGSAVTVADSHSGVKGSRVCWMGNLDRIVTTGFSRTSERQVYLWDSRELTRGPIKTITIDQSSGTIMPFWAAANSVLFLAGKGDGNVRYYEYENDDLFYLTEFSSPAPQRGMCFLPPRSLNTADCEIARAYKASGTTVEPISFIVPRKSDAFQNDLFPPAISSQAPLSAQDWLAGKTSEPILLNLETNQNNAAPKTRQYTPSTPSTPKKAEILPTPIATMIPAVSQAASTPTPVTRAASPPPQPRAITPPPAAKPAEKQVEPAASTANGAADNEEMKRLQRENQKLTADLAERDGKIRQLESKLEKVKQALA